MILSNFVISDFNFVWQGLTATGVKRDHIFIGDISTQYKSGNTTVDVKFDSYSNVIIKDSGIRINRSGLPTYFLSYI